MLSWWSSSWWSSWPRSWPSSWSSIRSARWANVLALPMNVRVLALFTVSCRDSSRIRIAYRFVSLCRRNSRTSSVGDERASVIKRASPARGSGCSKSAPKSVPGQCALATKRTTGTTSSRTLWRSRSVCAGERGRGRGREAAAVAGVRCWCGEGAGACWVRGIAAAAALNPTQVRGVAAPLNPTQPNPTQLD